MANASIKRLTFAPYTSKRGFHVEAPLFLVGFWSFDNKNPGCVPPILQLDYFHMTILTLTLNSQIQIPCAGYLEPGSKGQRAFAFITTNLFFKTLFLVNPMLKIIKKKAIVPANYGPSIFDVLLSVY